MSDKKNSRRYFSHTITVSELLKMLGHMKISRRNAITML